MTTQKNMQDSQVCARKVSHDVLGMMLAQAYMFVKSSGFNLHINKFDGVSRQTSSNLGTIHVDVVDGYVKKSWTT